MLRSMMSAPACAAPSAAERMTSGSWPKSWRATGPSNSRSRGSITSSSRIVFSLRWWMAKLEIISLKTIPAP